MQNLKCKKKNKNAQTSCTDSTSLSTLKMSFETIAKLYVAVFLFCHLNVLSNGQSESCSSGSYDRCWKSESVEIQDGNTFVLSIDHACYNAYIEIYTYTLTTDNPPTTSLQMEYKTSGDDVYESYASFINIDDASSCGSGSCFYNNILFLSDDIYQVSNDLNGFDSSLDAKIVAFSGISGSHTGWLQLYCYDSSQTPSPTFHPTQTPIFLTTTKIPTPNPTPRPTPLPTSSPTDLPTNQPTISPTKKPTKNPLSPLSPTELPSPSPSKDPSINPTIIPTVIPTMPSNYPSMIPTDEPSVYPSVSPSLEPSTAPVNPTQTPTLKPSFYPTPKPTLSPTLSETESAGENIVDSDDSDGSGSSNNSSDANTTIVIVITVFMCVTVCLAGIGVIFCVQYQKKRTVLLKRYLDKKNKANVGVNINDHDHITSPSNGHRNFRGSVANIMARNNQLNTMNAQNGDHFSNIRGNQARLSVANPSGQGYTPGRLSVVGHGVSGAFDIMSIKNHDEGAQEKTNTRLKMDINDSNHNEGFLSYNTSEPDEDQLQQQQHKNDKELLNDRNNQNKIGINVSVAPEGDSDSTSSGSRYSDSEKLYNYENQHENNASTIGDTPRKHEGGHVSVTKKEDRMVGSRTQET